MTERRSLKGKSSQGAKVLQVNFFRERHLFSADKVLVKFFYPKDNPLVIGEIEGIHQFADMFSRDTHIIWGISERNDNQEAVVAQIVASNLQKK